MQPSPQLIFEHFQYSKRNPIRGFSGGSEVKASARNVGDPGSIPGLGRSPGEGNGNPFQYSCLENSMDREAWRATVYGVAKSRTRLSNFTSKKPYAIYLYPFPPPDNPNLPSPGPWQPLITLCLYSLESYYMLFFVTGFFHLM